MSDCLIEVFIDGSLKTALRLDVVAPSREATAGHTWVPVTVLAAGGAPHRR